MPHISLQPLGTMNIRLDAPVDVGTGPKGHRMVVAVLSVELTGERINAKLATSDAADWLTLSDDGALGALDVRMTLKTHDGAFIYVEYGGRMDMAAGVMAVAPTFQTGAPQYQWLNGVQAIAAGAVDLAEGTLEYTLYEAIPERD